MEQAPDELARRVQAGNRAACGVQHARIGVDAQPTEVKVIPQVTGKRQERRLS